MTNHNTYLYSEVFKDHSFKIFVFFIILLALLVTTTGSATLGFRSISPEPDAISFDENMMVQISPYWEYKDASRSQTLTIYLISEDVELNEKLVNLDLEFEIEEQDGSRQWKKTVFNKNSLKIIGNGKDGKRLQWYLGNTVLPVNAVQGRAIFRYVLSSGQSQIARVKLQRRITPF